MRGLIFLMSAIAVSAYAANPERKKAEADFVAACTSAFEKSNGAEAGQSICGCTAEESRLQGVTIPQLKSETAEIRKDPKYKIANKGLLAAFHYCTISAMHGLEGEDSH